MPIPKTFKIDKTIYSSDQPSKIFVCVYLGDEIINECVLADVENGVAYCWGRTYRENDSGLTDDEFLSLPAQLLTAGCPALEAVKGDVKVGITWDEKNEQGVMVTRRLMVSRDTVNKEMWELPDQTFCTILEV